MRSGKMNIQIAIAINAIFMTFYWLGCFFLAGYSIFSLNLPSFSPIIFWIVGTIFLFLIEGAEKNLSDTSGEFKIDPFLEVTGWISWGIFFLNNFLLFATWKFGWRADDFLLYASISMFVVSMLSTLAIKYAIFKKYGRLR